MASIVRPSRQVSFSDLVRADPRKTIPADRLDSQIKNLIDAITSTQKALEDIRRDDGKLKNQSVGKEQLTPDVARKIVDDLKAHVSLMAVRAEQGAAQTLHSENEIQLYARDAEAAAVSAAQFMNAVNAASDLINRNKDTVVNATAEVDAWASDSQNWADYSQAQAQNAEYQQQQAAGWAEYLAGPVVDADKAPAYIASTPFGHGLYYQPVEGYGGMAGLWSAKWWAIYAAQLVGPWSFYYLGGWSDPPIAGSSNPNTGIKVPNPIPPGSFYYDTDTQTVYFWNGTAWISPYVLAAGVTSRFVYLATAGQTTFTGQDYNGATPIVGQSPSDVHLNGVKLVPTLDYNVSGDSIVLTMPATVNSVLQWDLLIPNSNLTPTGVHAFKVILTGAIDGTNRNYTMQYNHPTNGLQPVSVTNGSQLQVSLDGIVQEPGADYTATTNTLNMVAAPPAGAHFWVVWFSTAVAAV
jgi:hypothetical protein